MKSEDTSSLENLLTAPDQQGMQQSDQLLEFSTDTSPIQPALAATTLTAEKCMQNILIIFTLWLFIIH